jgi:DNA invertase Pin-like site-specific DNA recombinase
MKVGYARVSTEEQSLNLQKDALRLAGCRLIFEDRLSGATARRDGLERAISRLNGNDVLVVWKLDRLGRSLGHLIELIRTLDSRRIGFQSLSENIDTTTAAGRLLFHLMGALAEFERALIAERTRAGVQSARRRGVRVGRPRVLTTKQLKRAKAMVADGESAEVVARRLRVGRSTLYRALRPKSGRLRKR